MPKFLPNKVHPKTLALLELVRRPASRVKARTFFANLSESDRIQVAKELHDNLEIIFYSPELHTAMNKVHTKAIAEFQKLLNGFESYVEGPLAIQFATDIIENYDVNLFNEQELNLILIATISENTKLVEALLQAGADPTLESSTKRNSAWKFLIWKLTSSTTSILNIELQNILKTFVKHGVNPISDYTLQLIQKSNSPEIKKYFAALPETQFMLTLMDEIDDDNFGLDSIRNLANKYNFSPEKVDQLLNSRDANGLTLLMAAVVKNNKLAINTLLDYKVDINVQDSNGYTALHLAYMFDDPINTPLSLLMYRNSKNPEREANIFIKNKIKALAAIDIEPDINLLYINNTTFFYTLKLIESIKTNNDIKTKDILSQVINGTLKINLHDMFNYYRNNDSLIHACAASGNLEILKFVVRSGLVENDNLKTQLAAALRIAAQYNHANIIEFLYSEGVDLNSKSDYGFTALHLAAYQNAKDSVNFLMTIKGVDKKTKNNMGNSALDIALMQGHHEVAKSLLEGNLKIAGYTELMLAILNGDIATAKKLIKPIPQKILDVTDGGFDALMIATMSYTKDLDAKTKDDLFNLILDLIDRSDVFRINKTKRNFLQLFMHLSPENFVSLYNKCTTTEFIDSHQGKNWFHICAILGFNFSLLYKLPIPYNELDIFINQLDDDGNSPLSYLLFNTAYQVQASDILDIIEHGAKFIRNGIEVKKSQHIKAMLTEDKILQLNKDEVASINAKDQDGRTALHIACMRNKPIMAQGLLTFNPDLKQPDVYGNTPLHYAAQHNITLNYSLDPVAWDIQNNLGITPLIIAMQFADSPNRLIQIFSKLKTSTSDINKILLSYFNIKNSADLDTKINDIFKNTTFTHSQKLALVDALHNYTKHTNPYDDITDTTNHKRSKELLGHYQDSNRFDLAKRRIINDKFTNFSLSDDIMPEGWGFGFEGEIPGIAPYSIMATKTLASFYPLTFTSDPTVQNTLLSSNPMPSPNAELELVSDVINTYSKYSQLLDFCGILKSSGSTVNASAGMHVHFNCRGSKQKMDPPLTRFVPESQELDYLKYVAVNYIRVENLLRGFMRGGNLYDLHGGAYVEALEKYEQQIKDCSGVAELQEICSHNKTLDFTALNRHGTIEFRIHDGTIDPILINAWINCLSRLVASSRRQAEQHKSGQPYEAIENIEELVTLLITMRSYNTTWDPKWAAFDGSETVTASAYPGKDTRPAQIQIQESPLYNLAQQFIFFDKNETRDARTRINEFLIENAALFDSGKFAKNLVLKDLKNLLTFTRDNPGLFVNSPDIEPAIKAIDSILHTAPKP